MSEMSMADAQARLDAAMAEDAQAGRDPFDTSPDPAQPFQAAQPTSNEPAPAPEGSAPPAATPEPAQPAPAEPAAPADSEPSFMERADLDALLNGVEDPGARERIEAAYKSFQRGFTQARQRESEIMKQYEQLGSAEELQQLAQLRQQLQDPGNLVQLYGELGDYLSAQGLGVPGLEPQAPAAEPEPAPDFSAIEDPELEPFKRAFTDLRSELDQLRSERQAEQQAMEAQRLHNALVGELQRQENIIRQNHPSYTDADVDAVYELASFYDGNLLKAQERYESIVADRVERYLASKASAAEALSPVPANPVQPPVTADPAAPVTLDDAHRAAMEALRHIEAQDL